jgi:DNA recombination protein RmuC
LFDRLHAQERALSKELDKSATKTLETMGKLETRLAVMDQAQKNIQELGTRIVGLQDILANKQARGAFGEVQLNDLVTDMLPASAYEFQKTLSNNRRVDCLIRLPNPPGSICIDAKFPLESYHELRAAKDDAARTVAQRAFRTAFQQHVKDIESKYIVPGETAQSALMFLPSEAVYAELHSGFADMVRLSHRAKVWIVSPTTLMATLLTVRAILQDARMHEQAALMRNEVMILLKDVERMSERVGKLRRHFQQAGEDVEAIQISADKALRRGQKIEAVELEDGDAEPVGPRLVETDKHAAGG